MVRGPGEESEAQIGARGIVVRGPGNTGSPVTTYIGFVGHFPTH